MNQPARSPFFDLAIAVDWSARSTPSPANPCADACWIAHGSTDHRPSPEYFRTRADALARIIALASDCPGRVLIGFDFPLGYPLTATNSPILPAGRDLCALLHGLITDDATNRNNRFDVAAQLNRLIAARLGLPHGPFWGCPPGAASADLLPTRSAFTEVREYRQVELRLRLAKWRIQSPWKLYTTGSVGSQTLLGLPAVHRVLTHPGLQDRCVLWPFDAHSTAHVEPVRSAVVIAEIWPSLHMLHGRAHRIRDCAQVEAARDFVLDYHNGAHLLHTCGPCAHEGWILGVQDEQDRAHTVSGTEPLRTAAPRPARTTPRH